MLRVNNLWTLPGGVTSSLELIVDPRVHHKKSLTKRLYTSRNPAPLEFLRFNIPRRSRSLRRKIYFWDLMTRDFKL